MNMNTHVEAITHTDVRGNILYYLKLATEIGELLVNVGQKTHDKVKSLHGDLNQGTKLTIQEDEKKDTLGGKKTHK
jgi:hypothetical protein